MAYVNMTVDGQTKKTTQLNLKDTSGNTKTAILEAILEASDVGSSGGSMASGTFTPTKEENINIDTGVDYKYLLIYKGTLNLGYGYRLFANCLFANFEKNIVFNIGTNSGGSTFAGSANNISETNGKPSFVMNAAIASGYKDGTSFVITPNVTNGYWATEEYQWFAW